jgi:hypothetical protein
MSWIAWRKVTPGSSKAGLRARTAWLPAAVDDASATALELPVADSLSRAMPAIDGAGLARSPAACGASTPQGVVGLT